MRTIVRVLAVLVICVPGVACALQGITSQEAAQGLKEALTRGSAIAVSKLGRVNGYLGNPQVKIPLPDSLRRVEGLLRAVGMGKYADELVVSMNRAAEAAAPQAKALLIDAVKHMTLKDAQGILTGGDDAATQYFKRTTSARLTQKFLPIVRRAMAKVKLAQKYDQFAAKGARFGLVNEKDANLENYVTRKALDGLFYEIAQEERAIRKDPLGQASNLIRKVFGAVK